MNITAFKRFRYPHLKIAIAFLFLFSGCSSVKKVALEFDTMSILRQSEVFSQHHVGFSLYDIESEQFISNYNSSLLFTPASNTKLLTMYATLSSFQDSIPALLYQIRDTVLHVEPSGDPTFLLENFNEQPVYDFLNKHERIAIRMPSELEIYGAGWAWDDYPYSFQVQRSWWPIYGNRVRFESNDTLILTKPSFFDEFVEISQSDSISETSRERYYNTFKLTTPGDLTDYRAAVPFEYNKELLLALLSDTLPKSEFSYAEAAMMRPDTLFSHPVDQVLQAMLKPSDNFLAEQLLLMCAWQNGFQEIEPYIKSLQTIQLSSLGDMVWVDGSGLSRYNLISPNDQVRLLKKSIDEFGWERVTSLLPTGGEGTLEDLYPTNDAYIYAKTGTLSNNHNLSGFLITKSGKKLIFSLMNNHYTRPTIEIKKAMEEFIINIKNAY